MFWIWATCRSKWTPVYNVWPDLFGMRNQGRVFPELLFHEQFNRNQAHWHFSPGLCSFHFPPQSTPKDGRGLKRSEIVWKVWICIFDGLTLTKLEQNWTVHLFLQIFTILQLRWIWLNISTSTCEFKSLMQLFIF